MPSKKELPWVDVVALVKSQGGATQLTRRMSVLGWPTPTVETVRKWQRRRSIPTGWLLAVLILAEESGRPIDLASFVRR